MRVKRFELLHKLGLSQLPLPLGYTREMKNKYSRQDLNLHVNSFWNYRLFRLGYASLYIFDLRLPICDFVLPLILWPIANCKSKIKNRFGGLKGIQTLTRSLQDFYALGLHHQPENKIGVEGGIFTRTSLVLTRKGLNLVRLIIPPLRRKNKMPTARVELANYSF